MMIADGWEVGNIDVTLILEEPKMSGYINSMRSNVAAILGTSTENISVKATTTESLGPMGRGEGISAHAVALILKT